ncbi:MAG: hypothetical protein IT393_07280 [Nitrospirae bacterium]|nr:hypothetical protein [Nitrospirota bacterium]
MKKYKVLTGILIKGIPVNPGEVIELNRDDAVVLLGYKLIEQYAESRTEIQLEQDTQIKRKGGKKNGKAG